tara:strand:+ start:289 stop:543 length:255 start_codon:yes stop_codon:yes gene_type:complete
VAESLLALETVPKTGHISIQQDLTVSDQGHLGRLVISLQHLNVIAMITKTDIIGAAVITRTVQPEGVHSRPLQSQYSGDRFACP